MSDSPVMPKRLARLGLNPTPLGFGSFKIGRNTGTKYPDGYNLPTDDEVAALLDGVLAMGVNLIDTAPAYGTSEERIGRALESRRGDYLLSTKVGETYKNGESVHDFTRGRIRRSVVESLGRLRTDQFDFLFVHSSRDDLHVVTKTDVSAVVRDLRDEGIARAIGFSGYTAEAARRAMEWADVLMLEYNARNRSLEPILAEAAERGIGVFVKKGLASGHLPPEEAIPFVLRNPAVTSLIVGGLNLDHFRWNLGYAKSVRQDPRFH